MRNYELIFIVHPDLDENATKEVVDRVTGWITDGGGKVVKAEPWGKRKLAYEIRKVKDGQYFLIQAEMEPASIRELERNIRYLETILRHLITIIE